EIGFAEPEESGLRIDQTRRYVLIALRDDGCLIVCVLPSSTDEHRNTPRICILQITADATSQAALKDDPLFRALQERSQARIEPIVRGQQVAHAEIERV